MQFRLKDFAFFYSLQAGVVIISVLGMVIHTVALLKCFHSSVNETNPKNTVYQYIICLVFIALGLTIYILGLTGSALENSAIVRVGGSLLVVQIVCWIILMGISFSGECLYIRRVCVDNRCPERFYVQNGYWRKTAQECNKLDNSTNGKRNNSKNVGEGDDVVFVKDDDEDLGQLVFEEPNATELEGLKDASVTTATYETAVVWQRTTNSNTDKAQNSTNEDREYNEQDEDEEKVSGDTGSGDRDTGDEKDEDTEDPEVERKQHVLGVWTPIGDLKSNPHFILSVSYAVIILLLWYLYPVMVFFSFATQLDLNESVCSNCKPHVLNPPGR